MGWSSSWVAIQGVARGEILSRLSFIETGEEVYPGSRATEMSCREFAGGWVVLFSERFDWADQARALELSDLGLVVSCQFEDKVAMTSIARCARDGIELWSVFHDSEKSIYRLDVTGEPPATFAGIRDACFRKQEAAGGEDVRVDYVHDAPLELARTVCGFRADEDDALFMGLRPDWSSATVERVRRPSLLDKILAPLRPKVWDE